MNFKLFNPKIWYKLMKKINRIRIELELVQELIKDLESMYEYKELMEGQM